MKKFLLDPKRKNILITGASGFIGHHLSNRIEKECNIFSIVSRVQSSGIKNRIKLDLRKKKQVMAYFREFEKEYKIHTIIHLASRLATANEFEDMSVFYDNLKITESIVGIAKLLKPDKIINFSSIAVYPNVEGTYSETSIVRTSGNSECLYGLSKFSSENIIDFLLRNENIIISHLRVSQVYGEDMRSDRIMSTMIKELKEKNRITVLGDGERVSCFIHINKLLDMVDCFVKKDIRGVFNLGDEHLSYLGLAQRLISQYGNAKSKIVKKPKGSRAKFYIDLTKFRECRNG